MRRRFLWGATGLLSLVLALGYLIGARPPEPALVGERPAAPGSPPPLRARPCNYPSDEQFNTHCYSFDIVGEGGGFQLSVAVFASTSPQKALDPLLFIAGGPGEGGHTRAEGMDFWRQWLTMTGLQRDLILVDTRGNAPGTHWDCPAYTELSRSLLAENLSFSEESAQLTPVIGKCLTDYDAFLQRTLVPAGLEPGAGLRQVHSSAKAQDLGSLMRALGYHQWNLLAVSYGTRVALLAAARQPEVRRVILDGPYPPSAGDLVTQGRRWIQAFDRYFSACREGILCSADAPDAEALFWRLMARLKSQPVSLVTSDWYSGRDYQWLVNDGRLALLVHFTFYSSELRGQLLPALQALEQGESEPLRSLAEIFYNQAFSPDFNVMVYWATECNDNLRVSAEEFEGLLASAGPWQPYLQQDWLADPCQHPLFHTRQALERPEVGQPVLVATGAFDPVTPPDYGEQLRPYLSSGHWLTLPTRAHAEFFADPCGYAWIARFLDAAPGEFSVDLIANDPLCH